MFRFCLYTSLFLLTSNLVFSQQKGTIEVPKELKDNPFVNMALIANPPTEAGEFEKAYYGLAIDLEDPSMCEKINPTSTSNFLFANKGDQTSLLRSKCYFQIAVQTRDSSFCDRVISHSTEAMDGSNVSKERCQEKVKTPPKTSKSTFNYHNPDHNALPVLEKLGYKPEALPNSRNEQKALFFTYSNILEDPARKEDLKKKVHTLQGY